MKPYEKIRNIHFHIKKYGMFKYKEEILNHILKSDSTLEHLYHLYAKILSFYDNNDRFTAEDSLNELIALLDSSNIETVITYYKSLRRWKREIINCFTEIKGRKYHNGKIERKNKDIKTLLRLSSGYKNQIRLRARIMYSINKNVTYTSPII